MLAARASWVDEEIADDIAKNALQILADTSKLNLRFFAGNRLNAYLAVYSTFLDLGLKR